jgi:hypothetical protein
MHDIHVVLHWGNSPPLNLRMVQIRDACRLFFNVLQQLFSRLHVNFVQPRPGSNPRDHHSATLLTLTFGLCMTVVMGPCVDVIRRHISTHPSAYTSSIGFNMHHPGNHGH